ncbi:MAG TPA: alpha-hydroxy-acid oxidizing protein, partial [Solirubrobacterales bacterium]|nr:alpha-hydroxy-acid oxidizing protein [Solirubrobacterales bacterium]
EDARKAVDAGVDGVAVSNHGGRQLDAVPSTAAALPGVAEAVGDETTVLADGGIRNGLDMVKMLALGAEAVIIGRAWAWAVAAEGQAGVEKMLRVLKSDADVALALTGQNSVAGLGPDSLV